MNISNKILNLNWDLIHAQLLKNGYYLHQQILSTDECQQFKEYYHKDELYRSTIVMERYQFGKGIYRYFKYPLPDTIQMLREVVYTQLFNTANEWSKRTKYDYCYPDTLKKFLADNSIGMQTKSTPLILKYKQGDYTCLHQDIASSNFFPYQIVFGLDQQGVDYEGGHFILVQQRPRMQSIPHVITIPKGGFIIFSSNYHAELGNKGFYRTVFKHGVSEVTQGDRMTLGILFHDYQVENSLL
ncbi:2OG-Fe(II) oxygenase [Pigmentibacter sp. JX0631]|uniref:2OG-Fe(II) oxygenase n=1 Tax=Pigmentibacter sp. JX0631 TaxID=2976982 RepID=UPI002469B144|nr:2OG-Fe(II) oxygenase [Pigmentibacter sp. JX0631]WGL59731.1 2OG-Fe(II) oxygenase [Pigmentibacter sp. JX0631]